jgi:hypothetical protein
MHLSTLRSDMVRRRAFVPFSNDIQTFILRLLLGSRFFFSKHHIFFVCSHMYITNNSGANMKNEQKMLHMHVPYLKYNFC